MTYHNFHIPVMGIGFTADTPIKVAHYGISSVISLVDDILLEKLQEYYCSQMNIPFCPVGNDVDDIALLIVQRHVRDLYSQVRLARSVDVALHPHLLSWS